MTRSRSFSYSERTREICMFRQLGNRIMQIKPRTIGEVARKDEARGADQAVKDPLEIRNRAPVLWRCNM